ncbi:uncharacterized protein LOC8084296 [Sorghum bicolor]|uniref:Uncharacterized protein n=1 Tax=Sorghum bicolor TaxID=4558 RepID=C5X8M7_SORBI|nr:uncharacterized protein LOC8084296 [Sorghum bicolor]EER97900.2 hypothetical protein SORBI_3002G019500 [Sorghum bicolor]|eukprot:XP_002461379.2 uncharacterized protein LOC8084296 [Sorghum bicolor]
MAPPPPELIDDAIAEIILRLPPEEPQYLFRASLVCKPWRRLLTDAAFLRRYRRFHRTPPLLGLFFIVYRRGEDPLPRFIPTTLPSPFPNPMLNCRSWVSRDCRHGRVLFQNMESRKFIVWNPITGHRKELDLPRIPYESFSVAVLCAVPGCDHGDCHAGPFLVVWACNDVVHIDSLEGSAHACVYSSQVGSWGMSVSVPIDVYDFVNMRSHGALARDCVYFMLGSGMGSRILKYNLDKHCLCVIDPPEPCENDIFVVPTEDGLLGVAGIKGSSLYLWSRKVNAEGVEGWMQYRTIELQTLFPDDKLLDEAIVIAFAEGVRFIFMDTSCGISIIDLNSEDARTLSEPEMHYAAVPFMSFYTPDCACGKLPLPAETN